jgi:hypothetical protein
MESTITPQIKQSLKDAQAEVHKATKTAWETIKAKSPHLTGFEIKAKTYCYKKRAQRFHRVIDSIIDVITSPPAKNHETGELIPAGVERSQVDILRRIIPSFPNHKILPNIWNKKLTSKQFEKLQMRAWRNFRKPIEIKGCNTLAAVKQRIYAALHANDAAYRFNGDVTIDEKTVVVGKAVYAIEAKGTGKYKYPSIRVEVGGKRVWLRVDALSKLLPSKMIIPEKKTRETALKK